MSHAGIGSWFSPLRIVFVALIQGFDIERKATESGPWRSAGASLLNTRETWTWHPWTGCVKMCPRRSDSAGR